jgi:tRNA A37 methylthiotransferase MiaB
MLKVLFYHANDTIGASKVDTQIYLGVAALYLKTWVDLNRPEVGQKINWYIPEQQKLSDDELVELLEREKPDLFCTSHYIWNHTFLIEQLGRIRHRVDKNILFVVGGPSIDVNINPDFFTNHPYVDYAMYGAGEVAFSDLVQSLLEDKKLIAFNTSNISWFDRDKQKTVVAEFKYVPQLQSSPYTSNKELFSAMIKKEHEQNVSVIIPYDLTRGCPYSCTFCDWNSGLTNKTTRRKGSYQDEIDLFQSLSIKNIYLSDANVGQYQEDIDMLEYMGSKNINENAGFKIDGNFSKLRKENNLKIYHILAKANMMTEFAGFTISVQDINPTILENIARPDVGWDVHVGMIKELKECYPHLHSRVQLIQGLPGQTVASWRQTLQEVSRHDLQLQIFMSELLSASPAARDKNYQDRFDFQYSNSERFNGNHFFRGTFPKSCVSFTDREFVKMTVLSHIYSALTVFRSQSVVHFDIEKVVDGFLQSSMSQQVEQNLYDNWINHDKFYYTVNIDGRPFANDKVLTACHMYDVGRSWSYSHKLLKLIADNLGNSTISPADFVKRSLVKDGNKLNVNIKSLAGYV